jgi:hypothetical protein
MTETDDTPSDSSDNSNNGDLGGVLGEVGLDYGDEDDSSESNDTATESETSGPESTQSSEHELEGGGDGGPFAPEPGMQLTESFGTKLTPPEKEFVELYVEFSDEYDNPGAFLRGFVKELRREYGDEVMRRKEALEELKGGL